MIKIFIKFWPVLLPAMIAVVYIFYIRIRQEGPMGYSAREKLWFLVALASLIIAIGCAIFFGLTNSPSTSGTYVPAHVEDGKLIDPN